MPGKRAKILSSFDVGDLLAFASCTRHPLRNAVMVLLSAKAGLRAGEIANLTWDMVVDANGRISGLIEAHRQCGQEMQRPVNSNPPGPHRRSGSMAPGRAFIGACDRF